MTALPLSALVRQMAAAGAPAEAIALAIEAVEARDALIEQAREGARSRKQRQREREREALASRDGHVTVTGQGRDRDVTGHAPIPPDKETPPGPPKEINPPTPTDVANAPSVPPAGAGSEGKPKVRKAKADRQRKPGSRLPADWQPPAIDDLPLETQAVVRQWPAGAYELVGAQFRNHWRSEGRAIGAKRDWLATWCNWLFKEVAEIGRKQRSGFDFAAAARPLRHPGNGSAVTSEMLAQTAANFRSWGRDAEADEYERLAAAAREREGVDTS